MYSARREAEVVGAMPLERTFGCHHDPGGEEWGNILGPEGQHCKRNVRRETEGVENYEQVWSG
jgi:hypothetical protein